MSASLQVPFDVAVVIPTVLRPSLKRAVPSIFAQTLKGRVQIVIGVYKVLGDRVVLDELQRECPSNMALTVLDLGYSTSALHGGVHSSFGGGSLRTILSYAANSRYVAYLDDDNWYAPFHLQDLLDAVTDVDWSYASRWFNDPDSDALLCVDTWVSAGPGRGLLLYDGLNGFVDANCYMIDKVKCDATLRLWSYGAMELGRGEDKQIFKELETRHPYRYTGRPSVFYVVDYDRYPGITKELKAKGLDLSTPEEGGKPNRSKGNAPKCPPTGPFRGKIFGIARSNKEAVVLGKALGIVGYRTIIAGPGAFKTEMVGQYDLIMGSAVNNIYQELDRQFPKSRFILMLRERRRGKRHPEDAAVLKYFKRRKKDFLSLPLEGEKGWDKLCSFLGHPQPSLPFPKIDLVAEDA